MAWIVPFEDLTLPQQQAVESEADESQLLIGGPGAGKTVVLAHRLKRLLDQGSDVHLFAYTKSVIEYIQADLEALALSGHVTTIDSWACRWYQDNISKKLPKRERMPDFDGIVKAVGVALEGETAYLFDHVLVDEGQDLGAARVALLRQLAPAFTVAADDKQLLFTDGIMLQQLRESLSLSTQSLLATYRCCEFISAVAARFLKGRYADEFRAQACGVSDNARQVVWKKIDDQEGELDALAQAIQDSQNKGDATLAILAPKKYEAYLLLTQLKVRGIDCQRYESAPWKPQLDLSKPVILTYHSAKGMTFDAVFLPFLRGRVFGKSCSDEDKQRLLFVGITRATAFAWLGGTGEVSQGIKDALDAAVGAGEIFKY